MKNQLAGMSLILLALLGFSEALAPGTTHKLVQEIQSISKSSK